MKRLIGINKTNPVLNNTWVLSFPEGVHPRDLKLKGVYHLGKNVMTKDITWNSFDSICYCSHNGTKLDAVGRVGKVTYFVTFSR